MTVAPIAEPRATARRRSRSLGLAGNIALGFVVFYLLLALVGPLLAPHDPTLSDLGKSFAGREPGHPLGYDGLGRDLLSRLLAGARTSVAAPLVVVAISASIGTAIAILQAWRGGWTDSAITSAGGAMLAFPAILLALLVASVVGVGLKPAMIVLTVLYVPIIARLVRAAAVREVSAEYVDALKGLGFAPLAICTRHVLPNVMPMVIALSAVAFAWAAVDLAALSFLGIGAQPPTADWGAMVAGGRDGILRGYPSESLYAALLLVVMLISFKLVGDRYLERAEKRHG